MAGSNSISHVISTTPQKSCQISVRGVLNDVSCEEFPLGVTT